MPHFFDICVVYQVMSEKHSIDYSKYSSNVEYIIIKKKQINKEIFIWKVAKRVTFFLTNLSQYLSGNDFVLMANLSQCPLISSSLGCSAIHKPSNSRLRQISFSRLNTTSGTLTTQISQQNLSTLWLFIENPFHFRFFFRKMIIHHAKK